jgi:peptidoglycan hydrolase-like amidase
LGVPSNDFSSRQEGEQVILDGAGQGHGIGLCQRGAKAMAVLEYPILYN